MARHTTSLEQPAGLAALVLNELQANYPIVERPYAAVAARLGVTEEAVLDQLQKARQAGLVRQVCAIYDTAGLGYSSVLVAMRLPAADVERAAAIIGAHPGVSHCYQRDHALNLWFTLAMPPERAPGPVVETLHQLTGAEVTLPLPSVRLFKIGVNFDMTEETAPRPATEPRYSATEQARAIDHPLSAADIAFIRATQRDLPDEPEPFRVVAEELGWDPAGVVLRARRLQATGHLRRFGAILNHRRAGFGANGMTVWHAPEGDVEALGQIAASRAEVTHCYERVTYPEWPYSLYAMIHGRTREDVERVAAGIAAESGVRDFTTLYSTVEFKKKRLTYFGPDEQDWEQRCLAAAGPARPRGTAAS